jgi:hypothetical protein
MPRIAITGHRGLGPETTSLILSAIGRALAGEQEPVVGLTCLADGSDQIFAQAVLDSGGAVEAFISALRFRDCLPPDNREDHDRLRARATVVHDLPFTDPTSEAFMQASRLMVDNADLLWAVWDGKPARGYGGTADVVTYARSRGVPVEVIWPDGAERD